MPLFDSTAIGHSVREVVLLRLDPSAVERWWLKLPDHPFPAHADVRRARHKCLDLAGERPCRGQSRASGP